MQIGKHFCDHQRAEYIQRSSGTVRIEILAAPMWPFEYKRDKIPLIDEMACFLVRIVHIYVLKFH